jgi:hypothetical protein
MHVLTRWVIVGAIVIPLCVAYGITLAAYGRWISLPLFFLFAFAVHIGRRWIQGDLERAESGGKSREELVAENKRSMQPTEEMPPTPDTRSTFKELRLEELLAKEPNLKASKGQK